MLSLDAHERAVLSDRARAWWETNDREFRERLRAAIVGLASD